MRPVLCCVRDRFSMRSPVIMKASKPVFFGSLGPNGEPELFVAVVAAAAGVVGDPLVGIDAS